MLDVHFGSRLSFSINLLGKVLEVLFFIVDEHFKKTLSVFECVWEENQDSSHWCQDVIMCPTLTCTSKFKLIIWWEG